jgi:hypothetical protein
MCSECSPRIIKAIEPTDQFFLRPHNVVPHRPARTPSSNLRPQLSHRETKP